MERLLSWASPVLTPLQEALRSVHDILYPAQSGVWDTGKMTNAAVLPVLFVLILLIWLLARLIAKKKKPPFALGTLLVFILFLIPCVFLTGNTVRQEAKYRSAQRLLASGNYEYPLRALDELGEYRHSAEQAQAVRLGRYDAAREALEADRLEEALQIFGELGDWGDAADQARAIRKELECREQYARAQEAFEAQQYALARELFSALGEWGDAPARAREAEAAQQQEDLYAQAQAAQRAEKWQEAIDLYAALGSWRDAAEQKLICEQSLTWQQASEAAAAGDFETALAKYRSLGDGYRTAKAERESLETILDNLVTDWDQVWDRFFSASLARSSEIILGFRPDFDLHAWRGELDALLYTAGIQYFSGSSRDHLVIYRNLSYSDEFRLCGSEAELIGYVNECADRDVRDFRLYFTPDLAGTLLAGEREGLEQVLAKTRLRNPGRYIFYDRGRYARFSQPEYYSSSGQAAGAADTVQAFLNAFAEHTDRLEESFQIWVGRDLMEEIMGESSIDHEGDTLRGTICSNCGVSNYHYRSDGGFLVFTQVQYYAGKRLLQAYRNGAVSSLNAREKATLDAALQIVSSASGTDLEKERIIHDALCDRIAYYTDDEENDNDCAIGALLDGQADCDGYADAFYLCGNLAGIPVLHLHGDTMTEKGEEDPDGKDSTHMWNLVKVNGIWVMTDVTWDDSEKGTFYLYYNIGSEEAAVTHLWDERALQVTVEERTLNSVRDPDIAWKTVRNWDELYQVLVSCARSRDRKICLLTPGMDLKTDSDRFSQAVYSTGIDSFSWYLKQTRADLERIECKEVFEVCTSRDQALSFAESCARSGMKEFWLYFAPGLKEQLFAGERRGLEQLLAMTRLRKPFTYSYNGDYGRVQIRDAEYFPDAAKTVSVRSWQEVETALRENTLARGSRIVLIWPETMDLRADSDRLSTAVYASAVRDYRWSFGQGAVLLYEISLHDSFAFCTMEAEVTAYLKNCAFSRSPVRVYCLDQALYDSLHRDSSSRFFTLLKQAGCKSKTISYWDDLRLLAVEDPSW